MHIQQDSTNNFDFQSPLPSLVNVEIMRCVEPGSVILVVNYKGPNFVNFIALDLFAFNQLLRQFDLPPNPAGQSLRMKARKPECHRVRAQPAHMH